MAQYRGIRDLDWTLVLLTLAVCATGVVQIFSATHDTKFHEAWWKQIVWVGAGFVAMWVISRIDYHALMGYVYWLYGSTILLLVTVFFVGDRIFGSKRWISLPGGFNFQVSEFAKIVLVLLAARFLTERKTNPLDWRDLVKLGGLVAVPFALVAKQPDLGTALTYLAILGTGVFLAGLRWQVVIAIAAVCLLAMPLGWSLYLKDYQKARLVTFLDPYQDPKGSGYQVIQSQIAVGAGGMWGKGITQGSQTQLRFLPVGHTDFIFSTFAEEHGFVGVMLVLGLYFGLLMQIVQNAQVAMDKAGMFVCMGIGSVLLFHVLVNIGMVVGRMPVTGIPLPLMSSGGSSLLSTFMMLGLVNNVRLRRFAS